jgi:hypothetical protein
MIVLSESSPQLEFSASTVDLFKATEAAKLAGFKVYYIPQDFSDSGGAENAIWHIPKQENKTLGIWIGYIPLPDHYSELYEAALSKNIQIVNSPKEYRTAMEFDKYYPLIKQLTFKSEILSSIDNLNDSAARLNFPLFIKGTVQSLKAKGIEACVANNNEELIKISQTLLNLKRRSLGKVILREYQPLKHLRKTGLGFPIGREFRVFIYKGEIIGYGYYWEDKDELSNLSPDEVQEIYTLCKMVAEFVNVPYLSIDIGQKENNEWIVIELGDAQFSGISQIPLNKLWNKLSNIEDHP